MTKVKICGITNLEDAVLSVKFGADALGFNFYERSPRYIAPGSARSIIEKIGDEVMTVGVFVNAVIDDVYRIAVESNIDAIQLHGDEPASYAERLSTWSGLLIIKAFRIATGSMPRDLEEYKTDAILLDGYSPSAYGGTGAMADWEIAKNIAARHPKVYLAGGLTPENVSAVVKTVHPFAVDVASGVESTKGKKDPRKLQAFIQNARKAE